MSAARGTKRIIIDNASMIYFMLGGLLAVWGGYWFISAYNNLQLDGGLSFVCGGLVATGLGLIGIGFSLGSVERSSRLAEGTFEADEKQTLAAEKGDPNAPKR